MQRILGGLCTNVRTRLSVARLSVEEHGKRQEGDAGKPAAIAQQSERIAVHWIAVKENVLLRSEYCFDQL
jgi:hypothetical protein